MITISEASTTDISDLTVSVGLENGHGLVQPSAEGLTGDRVSAGAAVPSEA